MRNEIKFMLASSVLLVSLNAPLNLTKEVEAQVVPASSISIAPNLTIPEPKEYVKEKPTYEDVQKTMHLEEIKLSYSSALAELGMGIEANLGLAEYQIDAKQVRMYEKTVATYADKIEDAYEVATSAEIFETTMEEFRQWNEAFKTAIFRDRELAIEQKKREQEEERLRLEKILADEKNLTKNIQEVITATEEGELLEPKPDIETARVSYAIPELGRQYLTYMPHRTITSRSSDQWKLQQVATTDEKGYRTYKGMPLIALASSYGTKMGTVYEITFEGGKVLKAVLGDAKADAHTDSRNQYRDSTGKYDGSSGNILEMILDDSKFSSMNEANRLINGEYPNKIISIVKVGLVEGFR